MHMSLSAAYPISQAKPLIFYRAACEISLVETNYRKYLYEY